MMKGVVLLLIATLHTSPMGSKYLLVQLEDASDKGIEAIAAVGGNIAAMNAIGGIPMVPGIAAIAGIGAIPHQGKHRYRK